MTQDKIKSKIDEANEVLRKVIDLLAGLEAQLGTAEKLELKYLDFGEKASARWIKIDGGVWWLYEDGHAAPSLFLDSDFLGSVKGNLNDIFDEIEVLSKPLKEFKIGKVQFKMTDIGEIAFGIPGIFGDYIKDLPKFILDIQRLIRTAEVEAANDSAMPTTQ